MEINRIVNYKTVIKVALGGRFFELLACCIAHACKALSAFLVLVWPSCQTWLASQAGQPGLASLAWLVRPAWPAGLGQRLYRSNGWLGWPGQPGGWRQF
jgi:hypothetical protein